MSPKQEKELELMFKQVDQFAIAMKNKLKRKALKGFSGGLKPQWREQIYTQLQAHVSKSPLAARQEVDIANLAMMLWTSRQELAVRNYAEKLGEAKEGGGR